VFTPSDNSFDSLLTDIIKDPIAILPDRISKANMDTRSVDTLREYQFIDKEASAILHILSGDTTERSLAAFDILVPTSNIKNNVMAILRKHRIKNFTKEAFNKTINSYSTIENQDDGVQHFPLEINKWVTSKDTYDIEKHLTKMQKERKNADNKRTKEIVSVCDNDGNHWKEEQTKPSENEVKRSELENDLENFRMPQKTPSQRTGEVKSQSKLESKYQPKIGKSIVKMTLPDKTTSKQLTRNAFARKQENVRDTWIRNATAEDHSSRKIAELQAITSSKQSEYVPSGSSGGNHPTFWEKPSQLGYRQRTLLDIKNKVGEKPLGYLDKLRLFADY